jgi:pimeloyl-ACP methyl ester carboxylesterase
VLGQVNIETLVLAGAEDPTITLAFCEDGFRPHFTNLVIESIPNSGHYPMDETPLIFGARVGSFLAGPSVEH